MIIIGNINAGQVRIYKLNTFDAFTDEENEIYNNTDKGKTKLVTAAIKENKSKRVISDKALCENNEIQLFENDIVRLALTDRKQNISNKPLLDEIIYMEIFHNDIMWQILRDGININGSDYMLFSATTGQVRNTTVTLMRTDFYKKHEGFLLVGLTKEGINKDGGMNVGKYLAYTSLSLSASVLPEIEIDIDRCLLVDGLTTIVTDKVKYVDIQEDENGQNYVADVPKEPIIKDIEIEHSDGAGMFIPGQLHSSCQIRGGFFKGAMFPFDFRTFAKDVAHNTKVTDPYGAEHDIEEENILFLLGTSQLKMWKSYKSWEEYKEAFKKNGLKLTINNYANPPKDEVSFSYQYLQTLPYNCDIKALVEPAKDDIRKLHNDIEYAKKTMGYIPDVITDIEDNTDDEEIEDSEIIEELQTDTIKEQKNSGNALVAKALDIYPQLIYDSYIQEKLQKMARSKLKSYKGGKIPIQGYYSYVVPDMYAYCEFLFMGNNNPNGLVPKNHVYNKYYDEKDNVEHIVCLRSPHLSFYEYGKRDLVKSDDCRKWFQYMESDTVVSCHDLLSKTLQCDWDGDEILVSCDSNLWELVKDLPDEPLYYDMQKASPQQITNETIYDTLIKGFDNNVIGDSSNAMTKLWNTPIATKNNPYPYDNAINVFCAYSNYAIDYPKTGKSLALGEYEELYKSIVQQKNTDTPFAKAEVPLPFFMKFAKGRKTDSVAKINKSVMNRICNYVGQGVSRLPYNYCLKGNNEFDYRMLMDNTCGEDGKPLYEVNRQDNRYIKLYQIMQNRKQAKQKLCQDISKKISQHNLDIKDISGSFDVFHYHCVREIKEVFTNKKGIFNEQLAVNYLLDMEYKQSDFVSSSKDILWKCFGHILIENLQRNVADGAIRIKFRPRLAYTKATGNDGIKEIDSEIDKMEKRQTAIYRSDLDYIDNHLQKYKKGTYHGNDREIFFVLYCLYKEAFEYGCLKDGWYTLSKRKHTKVIQNGKKRKKNILYNLDRIMKLANAKSYKGSLKRFADEGIEIEDHDNYIRFRFDIPDANTKLFDVADIKNPMLYLSAFESEKMDKIKVCKICGKGFIAVGRAITCGKKCSDILHRLQVQDNNEKNKQKVAI